MDIQASWQLYASNLFRFLPFFSLSELQIHERFLLKHLKLCFQPRLLYHFRFFFCTMSATMAYVGMGSKLRLLVLDLQNLVAIYPTLMPFVSLCPK